MASQVFTSDLELREEILTRLQAAVMYVMDELIDKNKDLINEFVYGKSAPEVYDRTYEFQNAWTSDTKRLGNYIEGEFEYDGRELNVSSQESGQHISIVNGDPSTAYLADIIYEGAAGHIFGEGFWTQERNAYAQLDKWLTNTQFRKLFEEGMTLAGLPFVRKKAALKVTRDK